MGGLPKKSFQIQALTDKERRRPLTLDAGNLLFKPQSILHPQDKITATGIMEIYKAMQYDAVAVGPHDVTAGLDFLVESQKKGFPWLSANILDEAKKPMFKPFIIVERAGFKIGIIGLSDPTSLMTANATVADWRNILPEQVVSLTKSCDLIILLSTLADQDNSEIMRNYPMIHILITANRQKGNLTPRVVNNTLVTQTYSQGKYLGVLTVDWKPSRLWAKNLDQENLILADRLNVIDRQIARREKLKAQDALPSTDELQQLKAERDDILKHIARVKEQMTAAKLSKDSFSTFEHSFIALNKELPDDPEIVERMKRINEMIDKGNQSAFTAEAQPIAAESHSKRELAGFPTCTTCHQVQAAFWKTTKHAIAYQVLAGKKQNFNLDCLPCHVTLSSTKAKQAGADIINLPPDLQAVGCESCHGPGQNHADNPNKFLARRQVEEKTCLVCHTKDRSPGFDFNSSLPRVACPAN
jgi:hypothetical protein